MHDPPISRKSELIVTKQQQAELFAESWGGLINSSGAVACGEGTHRIGGPPPAATVTP